MQQLDFVASNVEQVSAVEAARYEAQRVYVAELVREHAGLNRVAQTEILNMLGLS